MGRWGWTIPKHGRPAVESRPGRVVKSEVVSELTGTAISPHAEPDNKTRRDGRRSEHRPSSRTESTRSRDPHPGPTIRPTPHDHAVPRTRDRPAGLITPGAAARRNHRLHALAIPAHVHDRTCRVRSPPAAARRHNFPPLLLHERLRKLPRDRPRPPRGGLPGLRLPPQPGLITPRLTAAAPPAPPRPGRRTRPTRPARMPDDRSDQARRTGDPP